MATATAPGNTGNATTYGYDANKQLTSITPPTGTSLGVRNLTYDQFGRTATATDGNGVTTTYSYDDLDRLLALDHDTTSANPDVEYVYDPAGRVALASSRPNRVVAARAKLLHRLYPVRNADPVSTRVSRSPSIWPVDENPQSDLSDWGFSHA